MVNDTITAMIDSLTDAELDELFAVRKKLRTGTGTQADYVRWHQLLGKMKTAAINNLETTDAD